MPYYVNFAFVIDRSIEHLAADNWLASQYNFTMTRSRPHKLAISCSYNIDS